MISYSKKSLFCGLILSFTLGACSDSSNNSSDGSSGDEETTLTFTFSPQSGSVGTLMTLEGEDISWESLQSVSIGGNAAILIEKDEDSAKVMVMPGSSTGEVVIQSDEGEITGSNFTIATAGIIDQQQGAKLVGSASVGTARQGHSVALSSDGNTAVIGGVDDDGGVGAAWIFVRDSGVWSQQGTKLVGTGAVGASFQGCSVAISADGNTVLIGGNSDDGTKGAAWVFVRDGEDWSQQGSKLVGTGETGNPQQGKSVSLSADGNTAAIGGDTDSGGVGAAWIFVRENGVWSQQGVKLVGTGAVGSSRQGYSVGVSADGNTLAVGGYGDNTDQGAAWVFVRENGVWSQQGAKLVGTGALTAARQGWSVSSNADGNTILVGGYAEDSLKGAAWVFVRENGVWSQQGAKLVGTGAVGNAFFGYSVSLSADGNNALIGGNFDDTQKGALWVFARSSGVWSQQGTKLVGAGAVGNARQCFSVSLSANGTTGICGGLNDDGQVGATWVYE